ncbi:nucleocapsid [Wuhan Insect virus 6]|uniref:Nucleoprotein n=1 Tax=Wuhan Insect virus 6 TaxID=1608111 RepID=A0A0B5KRQ0_9RHAB|nr:nucleocapsid [Wuhan Insect virus 6]AJG39186.1 nucleocapsid [Wuhan Insect virus 6]
MSTLRSRLNSDIPSTSKNPVQTPRDGSKDKGKGISNQVLLNDGKNSSNTKVNSRYAELGSTVPSSKHKIKIWDDSHIKDLKVYGLIQLTEDKIITYGKALRDYLNNGDVNANTVNIMLYLAVSLKSMENIQKHLLISPNAILTKPFEMSDIVLEDQRVEETISETENLSFREKLKRRKEASKAVREDVEATAGISQAPADAENDPKEYQAAAYAFIAAYLLRLSTRQAKPTLEKMGTMKERFTSFYDKGHATLDTFNIQSETMEKLRGIISRKKEAVGTWVLWLSYNENSNSELTSNELGMLEYVGLQIYAYMGMHAVTQTLALRQVSKLPLDVLLTQLCCQLTRVAVDEIYNIVKNYEITDRHPNRTTYFRYARAWDSGYFGKVQSKECPQLVYLAAKTVKELSPNLKSDPTQIYAVLSIGESIMEKLNKVSDNLVSYIMDSMAEDEDAGDIWK